MTSAEGRTIYGKFDFTRESQFMQEIDPKLLEGDGVYQKKPAANVFADGAREKTPFKPFDQLKYARQQTRQNAAAMQQSESFTAGDLVNHPKFGDGQVLSTDGKILRVRFADGEKKLAVGFAPLKKR